LKKILNFHQFIRLERGPVNSCIYDLLKGELYQVSNPELDKFQDKKYEEIPGFIQSLKEAELIIPVGENDWIPVDLGAGEELESPSILLELEEGVDIEMARRFLETGNIKIVNVHFFGSPVPGELFPGVPVISMKKDFSICEEVSTVTGEFVGIQDHAYRFNKSYNNCWGAKIAIKKDGSIRPCIYSRTVIGNISADNYTDIWEKADRYRKITKEKVEKCKDCEFKFACFDCREIAIQKGGRLLATNPTCTYDPYH
jgi:radical SAM protein with 4Fe4S-binding SPASM domain